MEYKYTAKYWKNGLTHTHSGTVEGNEIACVNKAIAEVRKHGRYIDGSLELTTTGGETSTE